MSRSSNSAMYEPAKMCRAQVALMSILTHATWLQKVQKDDFWGDHTPQGVDRGMGREASPNRGSASKEPPYRDYRDRDHRGRPDGRDHREYRDYSPYDPRDYGDGRDRRDRLREPRDPQPWRSSHDVGDFRRDYAPPPTQTLSVDPIHFRDHRDRPDHWDYPFDPRDPSPMRRTANSSFDAVDFRGSFGDSRSASREPSGYAGFGRMPSIEVSHGLEVLNSQQMDGMRGKAPPPFDPADEFKSWLRSALQHERESVLEVMKGRHSEILSQFNYKLEEPKPPAHQPVHMTLTVKDRTVANAEKLSAHPPMPGVPVVNEDWAPASSLRTPETRGKKVVLEDDTDAKSGGDESRSARPSFMSDGGSDNGGKTLRANSRGSRTFGSEGDGGGENKSKASVRMTHSIPHLRKNSLLEGIGAMPFWHPGRYVHTTQFDAIFCGVILANTLVMALEMQYTGFQRGYEIGFPHFTMPAGEYWPQAKGVFQALDILFGVIYTVELGVKLVGFKARFFKDCWNIFDGVLVTMWLVEIALRDFIQLDPAILRMMRMARLLRLIRLVKTIQGFDALYIMTTAMLGSTVCLFWSFMLLMTVQVMIAFFLNESLEVYFSDPSKPVSEKLEVFEYFGTTARVMLTMFELTLANWPVAARILQENVTEYYSIFSVAYKLIVGFAAVGIINGVFMQETFKVAASDDKLMMRQKERDRWLHTKKMRTLFEAADESGDGFIDRSEFVEIMNIPEVRTWLAAQELPVQDPNILFNLLDDGDAELTAEELVKGVERLKGTAKGIDLASFIAEYRSFASKVAEKLDFQLESLAAKGEEDDADDDDDD
ncbi:unnamed protein product [Cladocopium goreaui]|uniref:Sodium channel protein type 11 subunit alpha (NaN) (Sensory neuron sodium channel 2) (Sodium channel protein type XI subunit alpha) (Voltage-gated sodium channel subunit alpha Nav1.9) n=1 Tax=Cladocopium goreaui TaxID=2562237 RepID=A0A9P1GJJ0_9DINO|nr:unnamed protein product [Cladocopium goreaui]